MTNMKKILIVSFSVLIMSKTAYAEFGQHDIWNFRERPLEDLINQTTTIEMKKGDLFERNNSSSGPLYGGKINIFGGSVGNITVNDTNIENKNGSVKNYPNFSLTQEVEDSKIKTELNGNVDY